MNLLEANQRWPGHDEAMHHLEEVRWGGERVCPYCSSPRTCPHASRDRSTTRWQCEDCSRSFSATVKTVFHGTRLALDKWFKVLALKLTSGKRIPNTRIARDLALPYKTVWSVEQRIIQVMQGDPDQRSLFFALLGLDQEAQARVITNFRDVKKQARVKKEYAS